MCCLELCLDIFLVVVSVFFPPLAVWIRRGICSCDSLINICLCILGYIPGLIHAWYIMAKYPARPQSLRVYYVYQTAPDLERGEGRSELQREEPLMTPTPNYGSTLLNSDAPPAYLKK